MRGLNLSFWGTLGEDVKKLEHNGRSFLSLRVAVNDTKKTQDGKWERDTKWISCTWNHDGGGILPYLVKGAKILVNGKPKTRMYADKTGQNVCVLECSISDLDLLSSPNSGQNNGVTEQKSIEQIPQHMQNAVNVIQNTLNITDNGDDLPF